MVQGGRITRGRTTHAARPKLGRGSSEGYLKKKQMHLLQAKRDGGPHIVNIAPWKEKRSWVKQQLTPPPRISETRML